MRLYLLRHGETQWNRQGRKQGLGDSPLTERGLRQVGACADCLASELPTGAAARLVSSPLGRAMRSAELIHARLGDRFASFQSSDLLAEHDYGAWQALTESEIERRYPGELARRQADHWRYRIPEGESYDLVARRVGRWLGQQQEGLTVVAMTHDIVSRVLRGLYLALPHERVFELDHPPTRVYLLAAGSVQQLDARDCA